MLVKMCQLYIGHDSGCLQIWGFPLTEMSEYILHYNLTERASSSVRLLRDEKTKAQSGLWSLNSVEDQASIRSWFAELLNNTKKVGKTLRSTKRQSDKERFNVSGLGQLLRISNNCFLLCPLLFLEVERVLGKELGKPQFESSLRH